MTKRTRFRRTRFASSSVILIALFLFAASGSAADRVVVVPLGGTVGDAATSDVLKGKTFSSKTAGKGVAGTLKIRAGSIIYTNSIGMEFSLIPAGSFVMGSPDGTGDTDHLPVWPSEGGREYDERQHVVTLTKSFYMQTTEVTRGQWKAVMGEANDPSDELSCATDDCPVQNISWDDAQEFIFELNKKEDRMLYNPISHTWLCISPEGCYSLPTESQWEYAARAGTTSAFYNGDITNTGVNCNPDSNLDEIGWYCGNANNTTHPVAQKSANNWGLYDMSGNVWEWCQDWYATYPDGPVSDPAGLNTSFRVLRGGGWFYYAKFARSANRFRDSPGYRYNYQGFRLVLPSGQ